MSGKEKPKQTAVQLSAVLDAVAASVAEPPSPDEQLEPWVKKQRDLQLSAQPDASKIYQLALWGDDQRAMPFDFTACALFAAIQDKDRTFCDGLEIANANGVRIVFKGKRLTQVHADVWEGIMHLARGQAEGTKLRFRSRQFLRLIGRHTGKSQRDQLHGWITDLVATSVEVTDSHNRRRYFGSMLPEGARDDSSPNDAIYAVEINQHLCKIFASRLALINWEQRQKLRGKWLALWLQHYFARFQKPVAIAELHRLSGSTAKLKEFRRKLGVALEELAAVGAHRAVIDREKDAVFPAPSAIAAPEAGQADEKPAKLLPLSPTKRTGPAVSARARSEFLRLYPGQDADQCISDFWRWLTKSDRTADKPDAAFLGFAKKWIQGRSG